MSVEKKEKKNSAPSVTDRSLGRERWRAIAVQAALGALKQIQSSAGRRSLF